METTPVAELITNDNTPVSTGEIIKCGNCDHIGPALKNRSLWAQIVSWVLFIISPFITICYYIINPKYICSKCKSKFVSTKDFDGVYRGKNNSVTVLMIVVGIFIGIAILGILSSIALASLSTIRDTKDSSLSATTTATTTISKDNSKNLSQSAVEAIVKYVKNNTKFPKEVDKNTIWLDVVAEPNLVIRYEYMIHDLQLDGITSDNLKEFVLGGVCSDPQVKDQLLNKGVIAKYVYSVKGSTKTFDFNIDKSDCK